MKLGDKRLISQTFFLLFSNIGFRIQNFINSKSGFCYPFFYCHSCPTASAACPIRSIEEGLQLRKYQLILFPLVIIGLVGTISGRAVCGWACPIGLLQRVTAKVSVRFRKYKIIQRFENSNFEKKLRYLKYFILIGLVVFTAYFIGFMFTNICPVGFLVGTIPISLFNPGQYYPSEYFSLTFVIFILFLILIFTIERGWCKYFCPVGAMFAPFNKISLVNIYVEKDKCIHCNLCSNVCPMGIDVPNMNRDPECILCGKCISACNKGLIHYNHGGKK